MRRVLASIAAALLSVGIAACGDDGASDGTGSEVTVDGAWARTSPNMVSRGAVYMEIDPSVDDRLVGVAVDPSIAAVAEIHETVMSNPTSMPMDPAEMMMRPIMSLDVPADGGVQLKPGGYHIMLIDLVEPLVTGRTFDVTLTFDVSGDLVVPVTVSDEAP